MAKQILTVVMSLMMNNSTTTSEHKKTTKFDLKARINQIPNKMGFKIGEVAKFVGVKSYVLRYWETEFESLKPKKSDNGQRFYTRKDIEMALTIRQLLYEDRFSIEGAKSVLKKMRSHRSQISVDPNHITETTTESQLLAAHKPAAEIVLNKNRAPAQQATAQSSPVKEDLEKRTKEITQYWASSVEYLIEEVRGARKRLMGIDG
ncbi:MAG: MerR family transcriptional regulator [Bdellovibrionaceae bacterium]|nr:MerR family transcriptional regulator [Pseudobdellovibrionaceae bacterium]